LNHDTTVKDPFAGFLEERFVQNYKNNVLILDQFMNFSKMELSLLTKRELMQFPTNQINMKLSMIPFIIFSLLFLAALLRCPCAIGQKHLELVMVVKGHYGLVYSF
jgi:hypothetical protein